MAHANAAIFVPHAGCSHQCAFCDQRAVTGQQQPPSDAEIARLLTGAQQSLGQRMRETGVSPACEIAFFGGSFTAIDRSEMLRLLRAAQPFLRSGFFSGIRVSTRPDAVDDSVLEVLTQYGVTAVELGAQSMDDEVLAACGRGHTAAAVEQAAGRIRAHGLSLGLQMMTGLPLDGGEASRQTALAFAWLRPDTVRIYPTLVLENTPLARRWRSGAYRAQELPEAVALCADLLELFDRRGIRVIRLGLHDSPALKDGLLAGPYHPAFRELCEGRVLLQKAIARMREKGISPGGVSLAVQPGSVSKMVGHKRANLLELEARGYRAKICEDAAVPYLSVRVSETL